MRNMEREDIVTQMSHHIFICDSKEIPHQSENLKLSGDTISSSTEELQSTKGLRETW